MRLRVGLPGRLGLCEIELHGHRLDQRGELLALVPGFRGQPAPALDGGLEVDEPAIEAGLRQARRQVGDQRRPGAPLRDGAFGRVVRGVEIVVREVADQPLGPARRGHADLLAGHEFQRAVRAEMQHGMGGEILLQPGVESGEGVRRCKAALEQQPHRVALVSEGGLHAHEYVPEALAEHEDRLAIALVSARCRAPLRLDLGQVLFAPHMVLGRNARMDVRARAVAHGVALDDAIAQCIDIGRHVDRVALGLEAGQRVEQGGVDREVGRRSRGACIRREVEDDDGQSALRARRAP